MDARAKEQRLRDAETRNYNRVKERQLVRQLEQDINGARPVDGTEDLRRNPDRNSEDWMLGNQLEFGPRLRPHRGAAELHGAARESAEDAAWSKLHDIRRDIRRGA